MKPEIDDEDAKISHSEASLAPKGTEQQGGQRTLL